MIKILQLSQRVWTGVLVRTVDIDCPYCAVVSIVCAQPLSIIRKPDIDDVVF